MIVDIYFGSTCDCSNIGYDYNDYKAYFEFIECRLTSINAGLEIKQALFAVLKDECSLELIYHGIENEIPLYTVLQHLCERFLLVAEKNQSCSALLNSLPEMLAAVKSAVNFVYSDIQDKVKSGGYIFIGKDESDFDWFEHDIYSIRGVFLENGSLTSHLARLCFELDITYSPRNVNLIVESKQFTSALLEQGRITGYL